MPVDPWALCEIVPHVTLERLYIGKALQDARTPKKTFFTKPGCFRYIAAQTKIY